MKNWIKKIGQNKFQFFFFVGMVALLVFALALSATLGDTSKPKENPTDLTPDGNKPNPDEGTTTIPEEVFKLPLDDEFEYLVVRKFYEKNSTKEEQELALIKFNNSYRTSNGTGFARSDNSSFDVLSVLSGKVVEIKESPLYGNYVVIEHSDNLKSYYYGLSDITVVIGTSINQGDKLGTSGITEIDSAAGNHVYLKVVKNNRYLNPEKLIGKKISEI